MPAPYLTPLPQQSPDDLPEWAKYILAALVLPAIAAGYRFVVGPFWQWFTRHEEAEDTHERQLELKDQDYRQLRQSWREDKWADFLEDLLSFLKDELLKEVKKIADNQYRFEMTIAQFRDTVAVMGREIYELKRTLQRQKDDDEG